METWAPEKFKRKDYQKMPSQKAQHSGKMESLKLKRFSVPLLRKAFSYLKQFGNEKCVPGP